MTNPRDFGSWFLGLTGHPTCWPWQDQLGVGAACRDRLIRIPTGLGKTEGVLAAWSFHRVAHADDQWPRRLVWCLPMRVLVEQTDEVAKRLAARMPENQRPEVHVVMGGEDVGEWFIYPERPAIIIGTQDMLLSRALNRGYTSARARWPVEFGLLNHDALWVMDEVQLMDVGLATSAQLQAFRAQDRSRSLRPCYTWWMSATLQSEWLKSVDTAEHHAEWASNPCVVEPAQRTGGLWDVRKTLTVKTIEHDHTGEFAQRILTEHAAITAGDYGRITLVVCNTVDRACATFDALQDAGRVSSIELVHSRFRPAEREGWRERFLSRAACSRDTDRIIVATQVVEAGVDISAGCLVTELAPWPSLVQRFGRCARYGGSGQVVVVDRGRDDATAAPYLSEELESAWESLQTLGDVSIAGLESHEESLTPEALIKLYPFAPAHLLLRREFDELFDTTPDLTGADLDISRFIRSGDERDLYVFWIELEKSESPHAKRRPQRRELCAVPFLKARDWLCGEETKTNRKPKLRGGFRAWVWDWIEGEWVEANRASLLPGRFVCVAAACGGYRPERGFDPESRTAVPDVPLAAIPNDVEALDEADDRQDGENLSYNEWKTIACHSAEVANVVRDIANAVGLPDNLQDELRHILTLAGRWHDWGKSHPAFQGAMRSKGEVQRPNRPDLAKGPDEAWLRPRGTYRFPDDSDTRPAFRHELASALALFAVLETFAPQHPALLGPWSDAFAWMGHQATPRPTFSPPSPVIQEILDCSAEAFDLLVYLVASHHGKVRVALHAAPKDQEYRDRDGRGLPIRGVREGDQLPAIAMDHDGSLLPEISLTLEPAAIGLSTRTGASWRERCVGLLDRFGPAGLAYLESLLRAADVRASRLKSSDSALNREFGGRNDI
ncbi:MAG: CRISPR-associated helicase Cas3' [Planctomycetes bacterium]|nr:CRISPR-associated helicase Cas3' [Planctomycetota bacterium]